MISNDVCIFRCVSYQYKQILNLIIIVDMSQISPFSISPILIIVPLVLNLVHFRVNHYLIIHFQTYLLQPQQNYRYLLFIKPSFVIVCPLILILKYCCLYSSRKLVNFHLKFVIIPIMIMFIWEHTKGVFS